VLEKPDGGEGLRAGFIISKKIGGAVLRNRIKRVIKETLRKSKIKLNCSLDVLFIVKRSTEGVDLKELKRELNKNLSLFKNK